ncbi:hypothetical protein [Halorussus aquaticus]|uniref:Uncharacterized protein n=1 Tax=Halorussus aquaticus TaxID=2953748 RepID=A0ABD5Q2X9_9EURY|nr:hypothetical protein [Halorussus aquaticus]
MSDDGENAARTVRRVGALIVLVQVIGTVVVATGGEIAGLFAVLLLAGVGSLVYLFFSFTEKRSA